MFSFQMSFIMALVRADVHSQVNQTIGISPLIVIPGNNLVEMIIQKDAGQAINNGRSFIMNKILRNDIFVCIS